MKHNQYTFRAKVWLYPGMASWHFITLPIDIAQDITERFGDMKRGWGSLPITVTIGASTWDTSIFPDKETKSYLMPVKAAIRKKETIVSGDTVSLQLEIRV